MAVPGILSIILLVFVHQIGHTTSEQPMDCIEIHKGVDDILRIRAQGLAKSLRRLTYMIASTKLPPDHL